MVNLLKYLQISYLRPGEIYGIYMPLENTPVIGNIDKKYLKKFVNSDFYGEIKTTLNYENN